MIFLTEFTSAGRSTSAITFNTPRPIGNSFTAPPTQLHTGKIYYISKMVDLIFALTFLSIESVISIVIGVLTVVIVIVSIVVSIVVVLLVRIFRLLKQELVKGSHNQQQETENTEL